MKTHLLFLTAVIATLTAARAQAIDSSSNSFILASRPSAVDASLESAYAHEQEAVVARLDFSALTTSWGGNAYAQTTYVVWDAKIETANGRKFLRALMREKLQLMTIYHLSDAEYNRLAAMSFGIYGAETKFGTSLKYNVKENAQLIVSAVKNFEGDKDGANSRGGTQIKQIPVLIKKYYPQISPRNLRNIPNSAIATLGFLAQTLHNLRLRIAHQRHDGVRPGAADLSYITDATIYDYLPYIYSGQMGKVLKGPTNPGGATVTDNAYVLKIRQNAQALEVWESAR